MPLTFYRFTYLLIYLIYLSIIYLCRPQRSRVAHALFPPADSVPSTKIAAPARLQILPTPSSPPPPSLTLLSAPRSTTTVWLCCCCCCCQLHLHHRRQPVCASHKCVSLAWFECASARLPLPPSSSSSSFSILFLPHFPPSSVIPAVTPFDSPVHTNNSLKAALVTYCCQNASSQFADVLVCCQCITYTHDVIDQMCQLRALPPRRQRAVSETGDQCC